MPERLRSPSLPGFQLMKQLLKHQFSRKSREAICSVFLSGLELPIKNFAARSGVYGGTYERKPGVAPLDGHPSATALEHKALWSSGEQKLNSYQLEIHLYGQTTPARFSPSPLPWLILTGGCCSASGAHGRAGLSGGGRCSRSRSRSRSRPPPPGPELPPVRSPPPPLPPRPGRGSAAPLLPPAGAGTDRRRWFPARSGPRRRLPGAGGTGRTRAEPRAAARRQRRGREGGRGRGVWQRNGSGRRQPNWRSLRNTAAAPAQPHLRWEG